MAIRDKEDLALKQKILSVLDRLLSQDQWGVSLFLKTMHKRLQDLRNHVTNSFGFNDPELLRELSALNSSSQEIGHIKLAVDEKLVYARIYHVQFEKFGIEKSSLNWLKSLLDSIKHNEKMGIAIYEKEEDVRDNIRNVRYAYVTLRIKQTQDITSKRGAKLDPISGCRLLVIQNIENKNIINLTHNKKTYDLRIELGINLD